MQLRKFITILATLAGLAAFAPQAFAQATPNFERLNPPQPVEGGGRTEVREQCSTA